MKKLLHLLIAFATGIGPLSAWESELYGDGWSALPDLQFDSDKLIQDFSYAGYHRGERRIPDISGPVFNAVADYGADPSGAIDSTAQIQSAIDAAEVAGGGVVFLPAGTYHVAPPNGEGSALQISASNIVIRGAGKNQTFLLNTSYEMRNKKVIEISGPTPFWYWGSGTFYPTTEDLLSPTTSIPMADTSPFAVGDWILIRNDITEEWITEHNEPDWSGYGGDLGGIVYCRQIVDIDEENSRLEIDAPTRYALKTRDNARVTVRNHALAEVGLEDFSIGNVQHPGSNWGENDYTDETKSAFDTHASYLIHLRNMRDSWIRNVDSFAMVGNTSNAHMLSNGILVSECRGITVESCHLQRPQYGGGGGNGYMFRLSNANECLLTKCTAEFSRHGLVFSHFSSSGNVLHDCLDKTTGKAAGSNGSYNTSGKASDHHMRFSHSNLVDVCTADGSWFTAHYRPFGSVPKHNLTSAHTVFWNTLGLASPTGKVVHSQQARYGYVVGTRGSVTAVETGGHSVEKTMPVDHVEGIAVGESLDPFSLYLDQLRRRLALPSASPDPQLNLFFPVHSATLPSSIRFGESNTVPTEGTIAWSQRTGPPGAIFSDTSTPNPTVSFPGPGIYELECTAEHTAFDISGAFASATVTVTVNQSNLLESVSEPTDDAYVRGGSSNEDDNFGSHSELWNKNVGNVDFERESFLRFPLPDRSGRTILDARLTLKATVPNSGATVQLFRISDDAWDEEILTWANRPVADPSPSATWIHEGDSFDTIDLTSLIENEADSILSTAIRVESQINSSDIIRYASRDHSDPDSRPRLVIRTRLDAPPTFDSWIEGFPSIPPTRRAPEDNTDGDKWPHLAERFHLSSPNAASSDLVMLERDERGLSLTFFLDENLPEGAWLRPEYNSDPSRQDWTRHPFMVFEPPGVYGNIRIRLPNEITGNESAAVRLVYQLGSSEVPVEIPLRPGSPVFNGITRIGTGEVTLTWTISGTSTFRIYRGGSSDFADATIIGETTDNQFVDTEASRFFESYYFIQAVNEVGLEGTISSAGFLPASPPRPDLLIGRNARHLTGNNRYSGRQRVVLISRAKRKVSAILGVENDSFDARVRLRGTRSNRYGRLAYFRLNRERSNITGLMIRGRYLSAELATGARETQRIEWSPRRRSRSIFRIRVVGSSTLNPRTTDSAEVVIRHR